MIKYLSAITKEAYIKALLNNKTQQVKKTYLISRLQ